MTTKLIQAQQPSNPNNASQIANSKVKQLPAHLLTLLPGAVLPESQLYFHGKLTREQAEELLISDGAQEGLFLLRESVYRNYAVSICHMGRVHHYNVERQSDHSYRIQTGHKFIGPIELIQHHSTHLDGFLTLAKIPLNRPPGITPLVLQGLHSNNLEEKLRIKAMEMGLKDQSVEEVLNGPMRDHLRYLVIKDLHTQQVWYHHTIRRREAERRMNENGCQDGTFLVRYRKEDDTYVLSLMSQNEPKHYRIEEYLSRWSIEGGQMFETLMELIDHYHFRQDGLLCKLRKPVAVLHCPRSKSNSNAPGKLSINDSRFPLTVQNTQHNSSLCSSVSEWNGSHSLPSLSGDSNANLMKTNVPISELNEHQVLLNSDSNKTKQDLISFNDWPNVTMLLSNQQFPPISNGQSQLELTTNQVSKSAFDPIILPPPLLMNNFNMIPQMPNELNSLAVVCLPSTTDAVFRQSTNLNSNSFLTQPLNLFFTNSSNQSTANLDTKMNETVKVDSQPPSCLEPVRLTDPPLVGGKAFAEVNEAIAQIVAKAFGQINPKSSEAHDDAKTKALPTSTDVATQSLHFAPILDTPWEEPDTCDDQITSTSSTTSSGENNCHPNKTIASFDDLARCFNRPPINFEHSTLTNGDASLALPSIQTHSDKSNGNHQTNPFLFGLNETWNGPCCCICSCTLNGTATTNHKFHSPTCTKQSVGWHSFGCSLDQTQQIYDDLPANFLLHSQMVILKERLGGGNFGHVVKGLYRTPTGQEVPVAVKTLKPDQIINAGEREILAEAKTMAQLRHRHIVRLIGVCKDEQFMLVLELAPLGPINKYLKKRGDVSVQTLTELMHQVALGMAYLESCKFVHRDLAARNVLLVTRQFAKISDFGMSKALKFGSDYYRAATAGKWPLKWYAPECIYYFRFDSKSDVWSYGITLWEVYSYGERPYRDMKGAQILAMLDQGLRLSRPVRCPESIYGLMQQCWNFEGSRRPTFANLVTSLEQILRSMSFKSCPVQNHSPQIQKSISAKINPMDEFSPAHGVGNTSCMGSGGSGVNSGGSEGISF